MSDSEIDTELDIDRCRRKRDQYREMSRFARVDNDKDAEKKYADEARAWSRRIMELLAK